MARCQKKECNVAVKRERLINDFQELIDCMQVSPNEKPVAGQITVHKQLVCIPCPSGDGTQDSNSKRNDPCAEDDSWKKDRYKSIELKSGVLITGCDCLKRNGLQHDCPRSECGGRPPCLLKPWPDCIPSGGTGLRGAEPRVSKYPYKPAPCPLPDFPLGYEEDQCHKAEVDCKKCVPVLMCRPGEVWECNEGKCPPNPPSDYKYQSTQLQTQQCPLGRLMQMQECPLISQCPNNSQRREERLATNVIGQEIICEPDRASTQLRAMQQAIGCPNRSNSQRRDRDQSNGCPNREPHQRPGYETPQRLCRPANPQPIQQILPSSARNGLNCEKCPIMGSVKHCDPPTHVLKRPAYEDLPQPPVSCTDEYEVYCVPVECLAPCSDQSPQPCPDLSPRPCPWLEKPNTRRPKPEFVAPVYRKPPRSKVDDWMCQLPCDEKELPDCMHYYGEACRWHEPPPQLRRFTAADLNGQW